MKIIFLNLSLFLTLTFFSFNLWAFKISPMVATLSPEGGKNSSTTFQVSNDKDEVISIEADVTTRSIDLHGKEERKKTEELKAYPMQFQLKPKEIKNIRVIWTGTKDIKSELPFRLIVRQLPVSSQKDDNGNGGGGQAGQIKFLFEYVCSVYVRPQNSRPKLVVEKVKRELAKEVYKENLISLTIKNDGNEHIIVKNMDIYLSSEAKEVKDAKDAKESNVEVKVPDDQMEKYSNENILAGESRILTIKTPSELVGFEDKIIAKIKIKD
ncbi:MAG: molecular chaperone [Oligoflexia bacterium]|nr:molecular chaperone [Oligoflexia bacterium]